MEIDSPKEKQSVVIQHNFTAGNEAYLDGHNIFVIDGKNMNN